jgi:hypothetical protein
MPYTDGQNPPLRAIFRQAARDGWPRCDLQVDDHLNPDIDAGYSAYVFGWESASGLDSGTGRFPTGTARDVVAKSNGGSRSWVCVATDRAFFFIVFGYYNNVPTYPSTLFFGDLIPVSTLDTWAVAIMARYESEGGTYNRNLATLQYDPMEAGDWAVRSYDGTPGGIQLSVGRPFGFGDLGPYAGSGPLAYPNPVDGKGYMSRRPVRQGSALRAWIPGIWYPAHNWKDAINIVHGDTFDGSGALSGRSFMVVKHSGGFALAVEVSDTWYS